MKTHYIIGNELILDSFVMISEPKRYEQIVTLPTRDWSGHPIYMLDWKIKDGKASITYQTRRDLYAPIFDDVFPCRTEETILKKPGRNFEWSEFWGCWRNKRTGEKRQA